MAMETYVEGIAPTVANIGRVRRAIREENRAVVQDQAAALLFRSKGIVPYLTGELYDSAFDIDVSGNPSIQVHSVGYDDSIPYAWDVHETPDRIHPTRGPRREPKQDHFLSEPRDEFAEIFPKVLNQRLREKIYRMTRLTRQQKRAASSGL